MRVLTNRKIKIAGKVLISVGIVTAVAFGLYSFLLDKRFRVSDIEVQLQENASSGVLFDKIKISLDERLGEYLGRYIWRVDLEKVLNMVERDLRVKEAKVSRILPDKIRVTVAPYTPVLNIMGKNTNKLYPVARNGEVLPPLVAIEAQDGPILRGENFLKEESARREAIELLMQLPESGSLSRHSVSEIYFDKKVGFQVVIQPTGTLVWLGFEDFSRRASQAQRVVDYLQNEDLITRIVDARFSKKVVVRRRNDL